MTTATVEIRSQHAKGSGVRQGPDTYVAVQLVPAGVAPLKVLNRRAAEKRGIEIRYFGEGYGEHSGPRSMLGRAVAAAEEYRSEHNRQAVLPA